MKSLRGNTLGERLAALIEQLPITAYALSTVLEKNHSYVKDICDGKNKKPIPMMFDYLRIRFNVNPVWLRTGEGEPFLAGGMTEETLEAQLIMEIAKLPEGDKLFFMKVIRATVNQELQDKEE